MYTPAFVEFLGTSLLVGAVSFAGSPLIVVATFALIQALGGKISGGHFNPAVTAWALLQGKISNQKALSYVIAQLSAAVLVFVVGRMG